MLERIAGWHAVYHAIRAGRRSVHRLWIARDEKGRGLSLRQVAGQQKIPCEEVNAHWFEAQAPITSHQGVVAEVAPLPILSLPELILKRPECLLLLDRIQDPHNLGSLLRSALALGMQGVLITTSESAPLSAAAIKVAVGAVEYLPLSQVSRLPQAMQRLKEAGYWLYGAAAEGTESLWDLDFSGPRALVIGGEAGGLGRLVRERCDHMVSIPCQDPPGSLNAGVAGGILMAIFVAKNILDLKAQSP